MDIPTQSKPDKSDIPQKIFSFLIDELKKSDIPVDVIYQLEKTIVADGNFSEAALRAAITKNAEI